MAGSGGVSWASICILNVNFNYMTTASTTALFGYTGAPKSTSKVTRIEILQTVTNFPVSSLFPPCFVLSFLFLFLLLLLLGGGGAFSEQLRIQKRGMGKDGTHPTFHITHPLHYTVPEELLWQ